MSRNASGGGRTPFSLFRSLKQETAAESLDLRLSAVSAVLVSPPLPKSALAHGNRSEKMKEEARRRGMDGQKHYHANGRQKCIKNSAFCEKIRGARNAAKVQRKEQPNNWQIFLLHQKSAKRQMITMAQLWFESKGLSTRVRIRVRFRVRFDARFPYKL